MYTDTTGSLMISLYMFANRKPDVKMYTKKWRVNDIRFDDPEYIEKVIGYSGIDNPFNDIPLAAVLHSAMFSFSSERLAMIRSTNPNIPLYQCLLDKYEADRDEDIAHFLELLNRFRDEAIDTPIHEIIEHVLEETKYSTYSRGNHSYIRAHWLWHLH